MKRQGQIGLHNQYSELDAKRYPAWCLFSWSNLKSLKSALCSVAEALIVGIKFSDIFLFTKAVLSPYSKQVRKDV
ncbi:MAG TPA: hypothetical protein DEF72_08590 [Gammaproteobacteria bacterium]|nr:hypothetical protein [Gammaproteobacteria bacterium]